MKVLHKSKYWHFGCSAEQRMMWYEWFDTSIDMTDAEYKDEMSKNAAQCKIQQLPLALVDLRKFKFMITPEMQAWTDQIIFPQFIASGLKRIAFVVSPDLFAQVSLEQMMDEELAKEQFASKYFETKKEAEQWLNS
ncbi:hypothetical protein BKI52_02775 [marine bacterium AO1-C]|nr:hypothetical protein BKI52_02775 [marine bacterium AO1-C]